MSTSSVLSSLLSSGQSSPSSLNLSSLLQAMTGASTPGIDVSAAVSSAIYAAQAPERLWQASQTTLSSQISDLTSLSSAVSNLEGDLNALNDPFGAMNSLSAMSSDTNVLTSTASSGAIVGSHTIYVHNLVQTSSWYSDSVATEITALPSGSFTITAGGKSDQISVGDGVNNLEQLADKINSDSASMNLGITASVKTDSSGARLSIVSNTSGTSGDFSVSNVTSQDSTSTTFDFTQALKGMDASITVDGFPYTSTSNTIAGAINGVTLNLVNAAPDETVKLTVAPNTTSIASTLQSFVNDYNTIIKGLNSEFAFNSSTGTTGNLANDGAVRALQGTLQNAMSYAIKDGGIDSTLGGMGISMSNDGTLTIDSRTLNNALTNDLSTVQTFFQGAALNGFAAQLKNQLDSYTEPTSGAFTVDLQSLNSEKSDLQDQINEFEANYISSLRTNLTNEFSQAEIALQSLPQQQEQLNAELGNNTSRK